MGPISPLGPGVPIAVALQRPKVPLASWHTGVSYSAALGRPGNCTVGPGAIRRAGVAGADWITTLPPLGGVRVTSAASVIVVLKAMAKPRRDGRKLIVRSGSAV